MGRVLRQASTNQAERVLQQDDLEAWDDYMESCRIASADDRYEAVEPWAWSRLKMRLRATEARRKALKETAA